MDAATLDYLEGYRFSGSITGYREGELYFPGSPILTIEGTFAEAVVLETLALSVLNHDSAVATAAARMSIAAGDRPLAEMGSRRAGEESAVAAARAAYITGFGATATSRRAGAGASPPWERPRTPGPCCTTPKRTRSARRSKRSATGTTLLVDTYDTRRGVETAIRVAGTGLGGVRIDSGDLPTVAAEVRAQLDELGATATKITVTSDLDEYAIAALAASPVDAYGVGTSVVTGSGTPTAGMVYKLVARQADDGSWVAVAKASTDKGSKGGRKAAFRTLERGTATQRADRRLGRLRAGRHRRRSTPTRGHCRCCWSRTAKRMPRTWAPPASRPPASITRMVREELPVRALALSRSDPAIPTVYVDARGLSLTAGDQPTSDS